MIEMGVHPWHLQDYTWSEFQACVREHNRMADAAAARGQEGGR